MVYKEYNNNINIIIIYIKKNNNIKKKVVENINCYISKNNQNP